MEKKRERRRRGNGGGQNQASPEKHRPIGINFLTAKAQLIGLINAYGSANGGREGNISDLSSTVMVRISEAQFRLMDFLDTLEQFGFLAILKSTNLLNTYKQLRQQMGTGETCNVEMAGKLKAFIESDKLNTYFKELAELGSHS